MSDGYIKKQQEEDGKYIAPPLASDDIEELKHPAFCFKFLDVSTYPIEQKNKIAIANAIKKLGLISWSEIKSSGHTGCGYEHGDFIKKKPPVKMSKDAHLLIFRCSKGRMIGYRKNKVFYIFWFDWPPYEIYKHS